MFITREEDEHEEAIYRRTDHLHSEGSEAGLPVKELCRNYNISNATFYTWRKKYGGLDVSEARRLKALKEENARLKKLLAESMLDAEALKAALNRKY